MCVPAPYVKMTKTKRPQLGFGLMRLPKSGLKIDVGLTSQMVDTFLEAGFTYFDTAPVYMGSEAAASKALVQRHPRESYQLATKLNVFVAPSAASAKKQFDKSLQRTGAEYFDSYLLHGIMHSNVSRYERFKIWEFVREKKEQGLVRRAGFSFHGTPDLLDRVLTEHPEAEFVQLQINYMDWDKPSVASRACYEVAMQHRVPIIVMEPVKGGTLAKPGAAVRSLFDEHSPSASYASWAMRFVGSLEGIETILSGMSSLEQMQDNIRTMRDFQPLDAAERQVLVKAQQILGNSEAIDCTGCGYCVQGCPSHIPIPAVFAAANLRLVAGQAKDARAAYAKAVGASTDPSACVRCGLCEKACPQHLPVRSLLEKASAQCR